MYIDTLSACVTWIGVWSPRDGCPLHHAHVEEWWPWMDPLHCCWSLLCSASANLGHLSASIHQCQHDPGMSWGSHANASKLQALQMPDCSEGSSARCKTLVGVRNSFRKDCPGFQKWAAQVASWRVLHRPTMSYCAVHSDANFGSEIQAALPSDLAGS